MKRSRFIAAGEFPILVDERWFCMGFSHGLFEDVDTIFRSRRRQEQSRADRSEPRIMLRSFFSLSALANSSMSGKFGFAKRESLRPFGASMAA
jgi:hypothetical protein